MTQSRQAEFEIRFIWWALGLATFAGFALGAHVVSVIGLNLPLGKWFYTYVQLHGHIQLIGWAGLFIIGISLHFIPRLAGVAIIQRRRIELILWLITSGLLLRFAAHSFLPYLTESKWSAPVNFFAAISGLLEFLGIGIYITTILKTVRSVNPAAERPALQSVQPFFFMMLAGWLIYPTLNLILLIQMMLSKSIVMNPAWNDWAVQLFIELVLLPVAFAFSVRMFPLYLRLPAIDWPVRRLALAYLIAISLQLFPNLPPILILQTQIPFYIATVGQIMKGGIILWFIWKIDLLTRRRDPWTVHRILHPGPERRPTREGLPDYGEFGCFERLVYAAYLWLILAALFEIAIGISNFFKWNLPVSSDAVRHTYLLGFITHLILGMSARMIPGFLKKKQVAFPELVAATFWLGTLAALSRIAPLIVPVNLIELIPGSAFFLQTAFAFSGILGLSAVICLAINLIKTARL
jgi:uncharacterized protein involved in response to NO